MKAPSPRRRARQARSLKTYETVVKCAIDLVSEGDMSSLRFSQISKISKIPQSLIDYHFPTIQALHTAIIRHEVDKLLKAFLKSIDNHRGNAKKALEAYIKTPFVVAQKDKKFRAIWTSYYHLVTVHSHIALFNTDAQNTGRDRIMHLVYAYLVQQGLQIAKHSSVEEIASSIQGIITGYAISAMTHSYSDYNLWADRAVKDSLSLIKINTIPSKHK